MSEHRRKSPLPAHGGRAAARRAAQSPTPRSYSHTTVEHAPVPSTPEPEPKPSRRLPKYLGRTTMAGILLATSGALVLHEEPPKQQTQTVATTTVPHTISRTGGDGVWLHESPGLNTPLHMVMPEGSQFNVDCFVPGGDIVNGNAVWLEGDYNGTHGAVTDYYIDTHWNTTQDLVNQGIEQCGSNPNPPGLENRAPQQPAQPNPIENGGSVFYAPGNGGQIDGFGVATIMMSNEGGSGLDWSQSPEDSCNTQGADDFPEVIGVFNKPDKRVTTLGGWSIGRLGPAYFLQETTKSTASEDSKRKRNNVDYITLFDPGSKKEYEENRCDQMANQSEEMAKWLREDSSNNLVVFAGEVTRDAKTVNGDYAHQGIQETLFAPAIRGHADITDQVVVCNYDLGHKETYETYRDYMNKPKITDPSQCPNDAEGWRP